MGRCFGILYRDPHPISRPSWHDGRAEFIPFHSIPPLTERKRGHSNLQIQANTRMCVLTDLNALSSLCRVQYCHREPLNCGGQFTPMNLRCRLISGSVFESGRWRCTDFSPSLHTDAHREGKHMYLQVVSKRPDNLGGDSDSDD